MTLSEKIIAARRSGGLTQEELALRAQVTVRTIQRIENGKSIPRMYTLRAIAKALNVPYGEIDSLLRENVPGAMDQRDTIHFLRMLCLSCFTYLVVPYIHFLIPQHVLRKEKRLDEPALSFARAMVRTQIWWVVLLHLGLLVALAANFFLKNYGNGTFMVNYLWIVFVAYIANVIIIAGNFFNIKAVIGVKTGI